MSQPERLGDLIERIFRQRKQRDHGLADTNPDYVLHELFYREYFREGFLEGADWVCQKLLGKPLEEVLSRTP